MIGGAVFGRMTDGIFAGRKDAVDKQAVFFHTGQFHMHAVDNSQNAVPFLAPGFNSGTGSVGAADKGIEELVFGNETFRNTAQADANEVAVDAARFCIPRHHGVEFLRVVKLCIHIGFYAIAVADQMFGSHIVLETGFIDVDKT